MNFLRRTFICLLAIGLTGVQSDSILNSDVLSYVNVLTCAVRTQPWDCVYQRSGKMFDSIQDALKRKEDDIKAQADAEFATKIAARGFSMTDVPEKEKPSSVITSLQTYIRDGVSSVMPRGIFDNLREKRKKKKKGQEVQLIAYQKPEVYELVNEEGGHGHGHGGGGGGGHGNKDKKKKKKKKNKLGNKKKGHKLGHGGHGGGGDDDLVSLDDLGGLHFLNKKKHGRSIGAKRGKGKKKKKKALMKLLLIGAVLKSKIELLLKILGTHLQIKFFIISVISLIVNIARFWVDLKRSQNPQKVIYYENAHHQHIYDEHDDGWGSGSYWKRSLTPPTNSADVGAIAPSSGIAYDRSGPPSSIEFSAGDSFPSAAEQMSAFGSGGISASQLPTFTDPHSIAYSKQMPTHTYSFN